MKTLISVLGLMLSILSIAQSNLNIHKDLLPYLDSSMAPFYHGVASGDPTNSSVILWTKVTLDKKVAKAKIYWELSEDEDFTSIVRKGEGVTSNGDDFVLKPDVQGLNENTEYYYRFRYNGTNSIVGKTKTLPSESQEIDIAFASCSNFEWGYFNNYRFIAQDTSVDVVVHLGDYIYEYGIGGYGDTSLHRWNVPAHEIVSLDDYRTRYSLYRLDKDLIKAHQLKPFITTWDDHESANNSYVTGAQNHQPEKEGEWNARAKAARKAYYEWLPVRKKKDEPLYRSFEVGSLLNLVILDTRLEGRTEQRNMDDEDFNDPERSILGKKQYAWLVDNLQEKHTWKIIGNQVPFGPIYLPNESKGNKYMDGWDGYPYEQQKLQNELKGIDNVVFVTGDYHRSFAFENNPEASSSSNNNVALEFVVTSITSANADAYMSDEKVKIQNDKYLEYNPHMKYANSADHGYLVLHVSQSKITADFVYATDIESTEASSYIEQRFEIQSAEKRLHVIKD